MMYAQLLIIGCVVLGVAGDITVGDSVGNTVGEGDNVKDANCMTSETPVKAAERASKEAYAAAEKKKIDVGTRADANYLAEKSGATSIYTSSVSVSLANKNVAVRASNLKKAAMVSQANAEAKAELEAQLEKIDDLRRAAEQRVVARTHQKMKAIQADHVATVAKEEQDLLKVSKDASKVAHDTKAAAQNTALAATQKKFADVNTEHEKALALAFTDYAVGTKRAQVDSAALKKTIEDRATRAKADEDKITQDTFTKQKALAQSEYDAAMSAAAAKKADMLATAQGESKQAHMAAWVDTMSHEMEHATLCNGDTLSAKGLAKAGMAVSRHQAAQGTIESSNSAMGDLGYNEQAAISLKQK